MYGAGFAILDLETTGLRPGSDRVVEIAIVRLDRFGRTVAEYTTLVDPERAMGATHIHGIEGAHVRDAPRFRDIAGAIVELLRGAVLVAHNLSFDERFLLAELRRVTTIPTRPVGLCTMGLASEWLEESLGRSLSACCRAAGVPQSGAHRALDDARAATSLFRFLVGRAASAGRRFDAELESAAHIPWPHLPPPRAALPREAALAALAAYRSPIAKLVERLPAGATASLEVEAYLEKLDQVLEDRLVTDEEGSTLEELARELGIASGDLPRIHFRYLRELAAVALQDNVVNGEEQADLDHVARLLGFPPTAAGAALDAARNSGRGDPFSRLPRFEPGSLVCFSETDRPKDELENYARVAGLVPRTNVSRKTTLVVTARPTSKSAKLEKARALGIRIVVESLFIATLRSAPGGSRCDDPTPESSASHPVTGATTTWSAGWYADPAGLPAFRYWDGQRWTAHLAHRSMSG